MGGLKPPKFQPGGAASASGDGTGEDEVGPGFGLTDAGTRATAGGLRSADAIDRPGVPRIGNVLQITTSSNVSALPPEQMAVLQANMLRAGLLPSTYKPTGVLDEKTKDALLELKRTSQSTGMDDLSTLRQMIDTKAQAEAGAYGADIAGGGAATDDSPSVQVNKTITDPVLTDPLTIRTMFRQTLEDRLGRAPTADEYHMARQAVQNSEGGQDITTTRSVTRPGETDNDSRTTTRVSRSDSTTDPTPDVVLDDLSRRGKLGREANTVQAASFFDVIARRVGLG